MAASVSFPQPRRQLPKNWNKLLPGLWRHGPDNIRCVLVPPRQPLRPCPRIFHCYTLAVALMIKRYRKDHAILSGYPDDRIYVLEIRLVWRERIVINPGL